MRIKNQNQEQNILYYSCRGLCSSNQLGTDRFQIQITKIMNKKINKNFLAHAAYGLYHHAHIH